MRKKLTLTIFLLFACIVFTIAQDASYEKSPGRIGISYSSFGDNDVFISADVDGAASYNCKHFFNIEINYSYDLTKWLETEFGIGYTKQSVISLPGDDPGYEYTSTKGNFSLIDIPITLKADFFRFFFVNGGALLDIDASLNSPIDNQSGLGFIVGVGAKYKFRKGISLFVNPYTKVHSVLAFGTYKYHERLWENGWRFGVSFDLGMLRGERE